MAVSLITLALLCKIYMRKKEILNKTSCNCPWRTSTYNLVFIDLWDIWSEAVVKPLV